MVLEAENAWMNQMTILSNVRHVGIFDKRNGFKTSNAFLEYEGLSFEILYRGRTTLIEEAYREIFRKLQERAYFD